VAASASTDALPFADGELDLIYSRRGPSSHLRDATRVLRPGGLVAGLHTGAQEVIIKRIEQAGFKLLENREFTAVEILPTLHDLALFLSRTPGNPDYTLPEHAVALEALAQQSKAEQGYQVDRWWFMWVAVKP
jgi:SAM-dependent methyltransferase